jgi:cobalt-zinc-cadmium efflux system protein
MEHAEHHIPALTSVRLKKAFLIGISLNFLMVMAEVVAGIVVKSLTLLSDACHNLVDVGILVLSLIGYRMISKVSTDQYTYGYSKFSILVALFNAIFLMVSVGAILFESLRRLVYPQTTRGDVIAIVAGIAILINFFTALLFFREKNRDLNVKSAYLHLMYDAGVSAGIVLSGLLIFFSSWFWIDSVVSILIGIIIVVSTWRLLRDSLRLSMDGVPRNIDLAVIRASVLKIQGIRGLHHIHIWGISTAENAMTAHVVLDASLSSEEEHEIKKDVRKTLETLNIHHITLETEREGDWLIKDHREEDQDIG